MKKVICILLAVSLMISLASPVFAEESEEPQYGTLNVEYSDALGSTERLDVMVKDNHVYADAIGLSNRLGYECIQDDDLVSIYANNVFFYQNAPLLAVHFQINESKVSYNPLFGAEFEYTTPAPCIVDDKGVWVPLTYTVVLLGGNSTMLEDTLLVQMPQNNVMSIAAAIVNNEDTLSFDWGSHFGYSETTTNVTDGAARIVTLFSGLLEFDGDAWLSLLDWNAFDKKFGKSLATMFCSNSAEELQASIEQVELLLDVFSPEGKAGEMLRNKQIRIDSDVTAWKTACDEYLELLEQGSGSPTKYNLLYQQYERAVDDQSLFAALGGDDAIYIQNELSSAANVLDVASKVGSAVSYFREFQQKDVYQISVLRNYLSTRTPTANMPDATADAMMKYISSTDSAGQYVFSRFLEENALELIVDKSGLDAYLGLPANILLFAWDIMSGTIPFYSEGLEAVENREISNYAQKVQNDALENLKYLIAELKKSSSISAEDCVQLSEYCYVYLKACYIARSSAIKSLDNTSEEFREQIKGKLDVEADINEVIVRQLSLLSSADIENSCYILGFLLENNTEYLGDYSDDVLLDNINYSDATSHQLVAAAYIPAVEQALVQANKCVGGGRYGILTDMDNDTILELVLSYPVMDKNSTWIWYYAFSAYDYKDGSLITIMEEQSVGASACAAGGGGGTSVVYYLNAPMIMAYKTYGHTSGSDGKYVERDCEAYLYSFGSTTPTQTFAARAGKNEIVYYLDNKIATEDEFLEEMGNYTYLTYDNDWWISFNFEHPATELYSLLGYLQKTAKISPNYEPSISMDMADSIAHSFWSEEMSRNAEYKIVQEYDILKDGKLFYRFDLHRNYVADQWVVSQTIFIDSVSGYIVESLY